MAEPPPLDTSVPQTARIWNYWLGGKDNFAVDRQVGDEIRAAFPDIVENARASRAFLVRSVSHVTGEAGIRQFLDVGTGLPTADNTHEVAQRIAPESKIVYVDFDPLVLAHARALLTSTPEGRTDYIDADGRDAKRVLTEAARTLDFNQPVALIMSGILGHIGEDDEAQAMVRRLRRRPGAGQLLHRPGRLPQRGAHRGGEDLERERQPALPAARPRRFRPVLRRPRADRAGRDVGAALAPGDAGPEAPRRGGGVARKN